MLNINELEKRWLKYKIKSYLPHAAVALGSIIVAILIFILLNSQSDETPVETIEKKELATVEKIKKTEPSIIETATSKEIPKVEPKIVTQPIEIEKPTESKKDKKIVISPSLHFMEQIKNEKIVVNQKTSATNKRGIAPQKTQIVEEVMKRSAIVKESTPEPIVIEEEKSTINIKRENTKDDVQEVISRFNKNNSPALSLFVAKKYYEIGNYALAYNYALKTNEIDDTIEASWILFAKSLVKLGKKEQAVKTLQEYIEHSRSNRAKTLLDEIVSGKMK